MLQKTTVLALCGLFALSAAMPFDVFADLDDCQLCDRIVGAAERHHHNNFNNTTQDSLKKELERECYQFAHTHGADAVKKCTDFVDANIAKIYTDIVAGKRPREVCRDLGLCGGAPATTPASGPVVAIKFAEVLAPNDPCHTCAFIVGRAEHHFRPNETVDQLKGHLDQECKQLAQVQGQQAADKCQQVVDGNIQKIYDDIKAGKRPHEICTDIGECAQPSGPPVSGAPALIPDMAPRPHDPCRTCEFIIGRAEHHIHNNNVTDENRLLRELEHECIQLAHTEGDQASVACLNLVQKDIDMIFNDINNGKRPRQICEDMGQCQAYTGTGFPFTFAPSTTPSLLKKLFNFFHN